MSINPGVFAGAITAAATHSLRVNSLGYGSSNIKILNKNIVYKDTVLPLKELGENIKITSISNVEEFWLESCLNKIFESNSNVTFNTVQYSKKDKKVYFYTDQNISTKAWDDRNLVSYKPLKNSISILEEIKRILVAENNFDANCVSLYDVAKLLAKREYDMEQTKEHYHSFLKNKCKSIYHNFWGLVVYKLDYDNNELRLGINFSGNFMDYKEIVFAKNNNDLYLKSDSTEFGKGRELFLNCSSIIDECYDELMKFKDYENQFRYGLRALNSCFFINISSNGVSIFNNNFQLQSDFVLRLYSDKYSYDCNSNSILEVLRGNEDNVLKKIFVNISDCPEWMQEQLHSLRINQLEEEQRVFDEEQKRLEEERIEELHRQEQENIKERKKQKRLELRNKIFPFLKNK